MALREFSAADLGTHKGTDGGAILLSVFGTVYDVSAGKDFYGPGGGYACFAGKEVTRCLGKMTVSDDEANASWTNLNDEHRQTAVEWDVKFKAKYPIIGKFTPDADFEAKGAALEP